MNGSQVQQAPQLTIVPGEAASVAWVNASALTSGISVVAGEEGFAELATVDAYGNRITSAAMGITAELKHEGVTVCLPASCLLPHLLLVL